MCGRYSFHGGTSPIKTIFKFSEGLFYTEVITPQDRKKEWNLYMPLITCSGSTTWCRQHCYYANEPFGAKTENSEEGYIQAGTRRVEEKNFSKELMRNLVKVIGGAKEKSEPEKRFLDIVNEQPNHITLCGSGEVPYISNFKKQTIYQFPWSIIDDINNIYQDMDTHITCFTKKVWPGYIENNTDFLGKITILGSVDVTTRSTFVEVVTKYYDGISCPNEESVNFWKLKGPVFRCSDCKNIAKFCTQKRMKGSPFILITDNIISTSNISKENPQKAFDDQVKKEMNYYGELEQLGCLEISDSRTFRSWIT